MSYDTQMVALVTQTVDGRDETEISSRAIRVRGSIADVADGASTGPRNG